ncbi:MAG: restriction endonuclease subunit S [Akkermansia sp.]
MSRREISLADCCELITDGDHQPPPKSDSGIPFITISDFTPYNTLSFERGIYVPETYYDSLPENRKARKGDILYSVVGSFGIPILLRDHTAIAFQRHIALLRPKSTLDTEYLYYAMLSREFYQQADAVALGAAQRTISLSSLRNMKLSVPSIEEQRKVAHVLSAYDTLIENNRKQIKLLEEAARRLYKEWFVNLRFPGHEHTPIVNGIPEGWRKGTLHDMADMVFGQSPKSDYYNKRGMGLPFHQGVASYGDRFVVDSVYTTKYSKAANPGSILFSVRAPVGRLNITRKQIAIGRGIAALNHKNGAQSFLYYLLKDYFHKENIVGNGAIFASVSGDELRRFPIILPCDETIDRFNAVAKCYDEKIEIVNKQNELLTEARDRLLPKLMSGEIAIQ